MSTEQGIVNDKEKAKAFLASMSNIAEAEGVNFLFLGVAGVGKTHLMKTAQFPLLLDSFDVGGYRTLQEEIDKGLVIVRTWDADDPNTFPKWQAQLEADQRNGVHKMINTYSLDSLSSWLRAMVTYLVEKEGRSQKHSGLESSLQLNDYGVILRSTMKIIGNICQFPCHFMLTAHTKVIENEENKVAQVVLNGIGRQLEADLPTLFDELYFIKTKKKPTE